MPADADQDMTVDANKDVNAKEEGVAICKIIEREESCEIEYYKRPLKIKPAKFLPPEITLEAMFDILHGNEYQRLRAENDSGEVKEDDES